MLSDIIRCFTYLYIISFATEGSAQAHDSRRTDVAYYSSPKHNNTEQLYSEWSEWTECSRTCGTGIITRRRSCLRPPRFYGGVKHQSCHGDFVEHKVCNVTNCPEGTPDFKTFQCSQHNDRVVAGQLITVWTPADGGPNPCELRCEAKQERMVHHFGKVADGTPCPGGLCIDGRCLSVGCDDRLGSRVELDMCGVCGGRNISCVHYKDVFTGQTAPLNGRRSIYQEVVILPIGARNIFIRHPVGKNVLAMQDRTRGIIFDGERHLSKLRGKYDIGGTKVEFLWVDNNTEALKTDGPVTQELYVLTLLRGYNPGIYYEYWVPKPVHNPKRIVYPTPSTSAKPAVSTARPVHHHHPTKPPYAYPYGEKPYKGGEYPVYRQTSSTPSTNSRPVKRSGPSFDQYPDASRRSPVLYKHRVSTKTPVYDYYQVYRNASNVSPSKSKRADVAILTQRDSSSPNGDRRLANSVLDDAKKPYKPSKPSSNTTKHEYVTNGRLKYDYNGNTTVHNTSLSIAVLPGPENISRPKKDPKQDDGGQTQKPRLTRGGSCEPCKKNRDQTKHFCLSDFVIRGLVIGYEFLNGETRYELEVKQSFKNTLSLLPREFIWSPDTCRCPKLRPGKEYVIMGLSDNSYRKRESRLLVDKSCFVRTYNLKYARRLQKLRKEQSKKCKKVS